MIYPKKLNSRKSKIIIDVLLIFTMLISAILILINKLTTPNVSWAYIAICGIVYFWVTLIYSLKRNTNIAAHILVHMIATSIIVLYIDKILNFTGWSICIGIPIILMAANSTMLGLSIIDSKRYIRYAIYQLVIVCISIVQFVIAMNLNIDFKVLNIISVVISLLNFIISLILSYKEFYKIIVCKFHI